MRQPYTVDEVRAIVEANRDHLFSDYSLNRPPGWATDPRTRDFACLTKWLREEMVAMGLDELGQRTQLWQFNRRIRTEEDLFPTATEIMNDTLVNKIDRNRIPHRKWG